MPNGSPTILGQANTETLETSIVNSGAGNGLIGTASGPGPTSLNGVFGQASNPNASGVYGQANGGGYGVAGRTGGANRPAVYGENTGSGVGVQGNSSRGTGVRGETDLGQYGVFGESRQRPFEIGPAGVGVYGTGWTGVRGHGDGEVGVFGEGVGSAVGVSGQSTTGVGVEGFSSGNDGVAGTSPNGFGVHGTSTTSTGVRAESTSGDGVFGTSQSRFGVYGQIGVTGRAGVFGETFNPNGFGVVGAGSANPPGGAALFRGRVEVTGPLVKPGGSFRIDHPLDPETKYLSHSFVESPDMMNVYNGNVTTNGEGDATIVLPDYFEALNRDFRYQLTVIGQFAQAIVSSKIEDHHFTIKTDKPNVEVSWQVTGIRQDAWANAHRLEVEEEKLEGHQGKYLTPEEHGKPETMGVYYEATREQEAS
jgi:hypothetical protein